MLWPHLVNMRPLLGSFSDLKERMHGPNISTTPIVEASYLMRAPSPKSLNTASLAESSARLLSLSIKSGLPTIIYSSPTRYVLHGVPLTKAKGIY